MSLDRRCHPRYPVDFDIRVHPEGADGGFPARAMTLSRSSVQMICDVEQALALVKRAKPPYPDNLAFEWSEPAQRLVLGGQLLTHRRISRQHSVLVFLFRQLDDEQQHALGRLLQDAAPAHMR